MLIDLIPLTGTNIKMSTVLLSTKYYPWACSSANGSVSSANSEKTRFDSTVFRLMDYQIDSIGSEAQKTPRLRLMANVLYSAQSTCLTSDTSDTSKADGHAAACPGHPGQPGGWRKHRQARGIRSQWPALVPVRAPRTGGMPPVS